MAEFTLDVIKMAKKMDLEFLNGKMAGNIEAIGKKGFSMEKENLLLKKKLLKAYGRMGKGLIKDETNSKKFCTKLYILSALG